MINMLSEADQTELMFAAAQTPGMAGVNGTEEIA
jgi:hypothetical protein